MVDETANRVTETDAHTLVDKLRAFETTLSPTEQTLLRSVLQRAAGVQNDTQGHLLLDQFICGFVVAPDSPASASAHPRIASPPES
jgi:hypothetical protein